VFLRLAWSGDDQGIEFGMHRNANRQVPRTLRVMAGFKQ